MITTDAIDHALPYLKPADTVIRALDLMSDNNVHVLPVVDNRKYEGLVTEENLQNYNDDQPLSAVEKQHSDVFAAESDHILSTIGLFEEWHIPLIPVLDASDNFLGSITPAKALAVLGQKSWAIDPGGILVLEVNASDFSFSEIARIIESNNAHILYTDTALNRETGKMEVTIKVSKEDLKEILQSLERFNYEVKASFHISSHNNDLKERYDSLMMYLNV